MGLLSGVHSLEPSITCAAFLLLVALQAVPVFPHWCWRGEEEQLFLRLAVKLHRHGGVVIPPLLQQCSLVLGLYVLLKWCCVVPVLLPVQKGD